MTNCHALNFSDGLRPNWSVSFPDVVAVAPDGQKFGLEFEHSVKDKKRLVSLMRAYLASEKVAAVKYYAAPHVMPRLQAALDAISSEMVFFGGKPKIQIQELTVEQEGLLS